ncbi:cytochrome P450 [Guyanagaster necrorhizus]|uniref:Cytochrome P450 n=1 Tax=Guyanagaster necrorhizus TaxID=856835 RepID=A0A9P8ANG3_9AGAR|nr:cytochrome P450 [Guyanagaster necrorhizus MCA 3950]KAG7441875.1 cytochrome P450 [Guyanagaster necrorhizus MCA 3950]
MSLPQLSLAFLVLSVTYALYRRITRISLGDVPGPTSTSFLYGSLPELLSGQAGEVDFKWQQMYGDVIRVRASLGEERLLISDPKAIHHVYQGTKYQYIKPPGRAELIRPLMRDPDVNNHPRNRKAVEPAFTVGEIKSYLSIFFSCTEKMTSKWLDMIPAVGDQSMVVDVASWASKVTLDIVGEAIFDCHFGVLDESEHPLAEAYANLFFNTFSAPNSESARSMSLSLCLVEWLPRWMIRFMVNHSPARRFSYIRNSSAVISEITTQLLNKKANDPVLGKRKKDIMSLLIKAKESNDPKTRLDDDEVLTLMNGMLFAGHETSGNTLSWLLFELAKAPAIQQKLRAEIRANLMLQNRSDLAPSDLDSMTYLNAVLKETLRFHPISYNSPRMASRDDILPLSKPIATRSGKVLHELPIPKGTYVISSIAGYNRNKNVFGEDAHVFNPERWLNGDVKQNAKVSLGMYGNLFTFIGGPQSCMGWRFAVCELQALMVEIIDKFEFSLTEDWIRIRRESCRVMVPTLEGEVEKGARLPLKVKIASR